MAGNIKPLEPPAGNVTRDTSNVHDKEKLTKSAGAKSGYVKYLILLSKLLLFLLSLPMIAFIVWLIYMRQYDCENLLKLPQLQDGVVVGLVIIFVVNIVATFFRARFPVLGLLVVMIPVIVMFTMGLGLLGAYKAERGMIPGSRSWLKEKVGDSYIWDNIKSCVYDTRTCGGLISRSYMLKAYDFDKLKLSHLENGCCRPPSSCDMEFVNATYWKRDDFGQDLSSLYSNVDCNLWRNDENILCYNCYSCKNGFRKTIQTKWWSLGSFLVAMALLFTVFHLLLFVGTMWERHHHH